MRRPVLAVPMLLATCAVAAADRSAGVVVFTAPDGTKRILSVPAAQSAAEARVSASAPAAAWSSRDRASAPRTSRPGPVA